MVPLSSVRSDSGCAHNEYKFLHGALCFVFIKDSEFQKYSQEGFLKPQFKDHYNLLIYRYQAF